MPKGGRGRGRAKGKGRAQLLTDSESLRPARRPDVSIQADLPQTGAAPCIHLRSESISSSEQEACEEEKGARRVSSDKEVATEKKLAEGATIKGATAAIPADAEVSQVTQQLSQLTTTSSIGENGNFHALKQITVPSSLQAGYTERAELLKFPRRPDYGKVGQPIKLFSNFFALTLPKSDLIYHYDVTITPDAAKSVHREVMEQVYERYAGEAFGKARPAFDGTKNLYTMKDLPVARDGAKLVVVLPSQDEKKDKRFTVVIRFAAKVYLKELKDFLFGKGVGTRPQDALMTLDIILRHIPSFKFESVGKGIFCPPNSRSFDLGEGIDLRFGFYQSVRHSEWQTVLVNVDVSAKAFYKQQPLVNFICQVLNIGIQDLDNPRLFDDKRKFNQLKDAIIGLRVMTNHLGKVKRKFVIGRITKPANQATFQSAGNEVTVADYMKSKYGMTLRFPNLPCVTRPTHDAQFPLEVLDVVPCVRKKITDEQRVKVIRKTARPAKEREEDIRSWAKQLEEINRDFVGKEFGMQMQPHMTDVQGRVLPAPVLAIGGQDNRLTPRDGSWDMRNKQFYKGVDINCWAIVLFMNVNFCRSDAVRKFTSTFKNVASREGVRVTSDPVAVTYERPHKVEELLCSLKTEHHKLQFIFCVLPDTKKTLYGEIKRVGDNVIGVATQCVQSKFVQNPKPHVISNICMKINAKLGGINHIICKDAQALVFKESVIVFGADVTHPQAGDRVSPSIAAVVASVDLQASSYTAIAHAQATKKNKPSKKCETVEIIEKLDEIVKELLVRYYKRTKCKPRKILFYRDGVSEGQFEQVYMYELRAIQKACMDLPGNYRPGITLVVVQKRHHARFFCADVKDRSGKAGNIPAGTAVDRGVVHPYEFDFYLCSHFGIQGTSRPTHYHVLHDDNKFTADHLQQVTNDLCYTFARCTRSVSIPSPAYYAHLVAFRARYHMRTEKFYNGKKPKTQEEILRIVNNDIKVEETHSHSMYFA